MRLKEVPTSLTGRYIPIEILMMLFVKHLICVQLAYQTVRKRSCMSSENMEKVKLYPLEMY